MPKIHFRGEIFQEDDLYVGICPELNVSSFGISIEEARQSLHEAVELFIEECEESGALDEVMEEAGFVTEHDAWISRKPITAELLSVG